MYLQIVLLYTGTYLGPEIRIYFCKISIIWIKIIYSLRKFHIQKDFGPREAADPHENNV